MKVRERKMSFVSYPTLLVLVVPLKNYFSRPLAIITLIIEICVAEDDVPTTNSDVGISATDVTGGVVPSTTGSGGVDPMTPTTETPTMETVTETTATSEMNGSESPTGATMAAVDDPTIATTVTAAAIVTTDETATMTFLSDDYTNWIPLWGRMEDGGFTINTATSANTKATSGNTEATSGNTEATSANTEVTSANTEATSANTEATSANTEVTSANTEATSANTEVTSANTEATSKQSGDDTMMVIIEKGGTTSVMPFYDLTMPGDKDSMEITTPSSTKTMTDINQSAIDSGSMEAGTDLLTTSESTASAVGRMEELIKMASNASGPEESATNMAGLDESMAAVTMAGSDPTMTNNVSWAATTISGMEEATTTVGWIDPTMTAETTASEGGAESAASTTTVEGNEVAGSDEGQSATENAPSEESLAASTMAYMEEGAIPAAVSDPTMPAETTDSEGGAESPVSTPIADGWQNSDIAWLATLVGLDEGQSATENAPSEESLAASTMPGMEEAATSVGGTDPTMGAEPTASEGGAESAASTTTVDGGEVETTLAGSDEGQSANAPSEESMAASTMAYMEEGAIPAAGTDPTMPAETIASEGGAESSAFISIAVEWQSSDIAWLAILAGVDEGQSATENAPSEESLAASTTPGMEGAATSVGGTDPTMGAEPTASEGGAESAASTTTVEGGEVETTLAGSDEGQSANAPSEESMAASTMAYMEEGAIPAAGTDPTMPAGTDPTMPAETTASEGGVESSAFISIAVVWQSSNIAWLAILAGVDEGQSATENAPREESLAASTMPGIEGAATSVGGTDPTMGAESTASEGGAESAASTTTVEGGEVETTLVGSDEGQSANAPSEELMAASNMPGMEEAVNTVTDQDVQTAVGTTSSGAGEESVPSTTMGGECEPSATTGTSEVSVTEVSETPSSSESEG